MPAGRRRRKEAEGGGNRARLETKPKTKPETKQSRAPVGRGLAASVLRRGQAGRSLWEPAPTGHGQPWRALKRGFFLLITYTRPLRRTTRQPSSRRLDVLRGVTPFLHISSLVRVSHPPALPQP